MPEPIPAEAAPLTCEWCRNSPATQVFSVDRLGLGRQTDFVCAPCGNVEEPHARRTWGQVWRFRLTPFQEAADRA